MKLSEDQAPHELIFPRVPATPVIVVEVITVCGGELTRYTPVPPPVVGDVKVVCESTCTRVGTVLAPEPPVRNWPTAMTPELTAVTVMTPLMAMEPVNTAGTSTLEPQ